MLYNERKMPTTPDVLRALLLLCLAGMALMAALYLRHRKLSLSEYIAWGLLALFIPILGPFLVILSQPGKNSQL